MDYDKLKQIFPFLKNIDLENDATRKSLVITIVGIGVLLIAAALLVRVTFGGGKPAVNAETDADRPVVTIDTPQGADNDILSVTDKSEIYGRRQQGSYAEQVFSESESINSRLADTVEQEENKKKKVSDFFRISSEQEQSEGPSFDKKIGDGMQTASVTSAKPSSARPKSGRQQLIEMGYDPDTGLPLSSPASADTGEPEKKDTVFIREETPQVAEEIEVLVPKAGHKSGGVTSLSDDDWGASTGVSSLDEENESIDEDAAHPFEVMFAKDAKIGNGGRVTLRLLEDMYIGGMKIPANTPLSGICNIGNRRLEIEVSALKVGAKIYTLNLEAYDTDGIKGLYCPETNLGKSAEQGKRSATSIISSALGSGITGYAGQIVNAGASIIQTQQGEVSINVTSGYKFYLIRKQN